MRCFFFLYLLFIFLSSTLQSPPPSARAHWRKPCGCRGLRDRWRWLRCVFPPLVRLFGKSPAGVASWMCWEMSHDACLSCVCYSDCVSCSCTWKKGCEVWTPCRPCVNFTYCWKEDLGLGPGWIDAPDGLELKGSCHTNNTKTYI